jgi:5-oxoprolinase (ATP-hydrolysing)
VDGGDPGQVGRDWVERTDGTIESIEGIDACDVRPGDVFGMETPAGGGWGTPDNPR